MHSSTVLRVVNSTYITPALGNCETVKDGCAIQSQALRMMKDMVAVVGIVVLDIDVTAKDRLIQHQII